MTAWSIVSVHDGPPLGARPRWADAICSGWRRSFSPVSPQSVFYSGVVFVRAENEPQRRLVTGSAFLPVVIIDVELKLAEIAVRELADLKIEQDVAFQDDVIKHEIDVEVIALERESLLPGDEGKAFSEFQEEGLQLIQQRLLDIRLGEAVRFRQAEKFDNDRIFEYIGRRGNFMAFGRQPNPAGFIAAFGETFEQKAGDLAFEFARGPALLN